VYGPDWPWYWPNSETASPDTPVLENGYCRVRYDATNSPGWRIDAWTGAAWTEQCKVCVGRITGGGAYDLETTLMSAVLEEYTPERAVMKVVMLTTADSASREVIFITLQRGWTGPRFEVYPAPASAGVQAGAWLLLQTPATDSDDSAFAIAAGGATNVSTALGAGHTGLFSAVQIVGTMSDNGCAFLRSAAAGSGGLALAYQLSFATVQAASYAEVSNVANAYGVSRNAFYIISAASAGYVSGQLAMLPVDAHQIMEAENMTLGTGTSSSADATASQALAASATRTSDANTHCSQAGWPDSDVGVYRMFARVRVTAGTGSIYAKTDSGSGGSGTTGATKTTTSTSYVWLDLGDLVGAAGVLEIHAWTSSGTIYVDRIEAYQRQDRTATNPTFGGTQDVGQSALYESYVVGGIVSRV
jgi:hypothetical protein